MRQPATRYIGFLGRFWFQMVDMIRMARRAHHACSRGSGRKKNRWESSVSAMSKKKLHTYCVFETPNRYNPIVVTGQFAFLHTLQHFWEVIFPFLHTLHGFWEVVFSILQKSPFVQPMLECTCFWRIFTFFENLHFKIDPATSYFLYFFEKK